MDDTEIRRAVRAMTAMLQNGEWAEHVSKDRDAMALESAITELHNELHATHPQAPASPQPEAEAQKADDLPGMWHASDFSGGETDCATPSAGAPLPAQRQEAAQVEASGLSAGAAYALKNPQGVWSSYEVEKREHARCEAELRNCEARIREQRAEIKRLVAAPTPQAVKVPLNPHIIFDALPLNAGRRTSFENVEDVLAAIAKRYGIQPSEGERSHD